MKLLHHKIKPEEWVKFSKKRQILNIAAELCRIQQGELYQNVGPGDIKNAYERALELIDLTLQDPKWQGFHQLYELRDCIATLYLGKTNPVIVKFFYTWLMNLSKNI
jgi:hypothetical protein